ncbi:MAG: hypothetical protein KY476_21905 [Planctomycetes bacterium]|nr:hypothetical protein [Planctomycetota bacterium]
MFTARSRAALAADDPLQAVTAVVRRLKECGHGQREVYELLGDLRCQLAAEGQEAAEDVLLEVMDFVSGFASERHRIWDEPLNVP